MKEASVSSLVRQIRRTEAYFEWKRAVFLRDRFTCQHCGRRNGRKRVIEADHIISLASLVRDNNLTSVEEALECPFLRDVSNGRTLCHDCHEETESYPENFKRKKLTVSWL